MDPGLDHKPFRVHENVAFPAAHLLAPSKTLCSPPTPVVFADWLSTIPAPGSGSLPSFSLNRWRKRRFIRSQIPSMRHLLK
jgi:hypothetical protein